MHEMHIISDLLKDIIKLAEANNTKKITKLYLRMGKFTEINEEIIRFFLKEKGVGTVIEGAEIDIVSSENRELSLLSFDCE